MKTKKYLFVLLTVVLLYTLTGCYTQVATNEPEPYYSTTIVYKQNTDDSNYYSEDGEELDSSYYSEFDAETDESVTIINKYYYPYDYYYYPYFSIGIGFSWYWGWGSFYSYWPYYSYYPYYPYYTGWCE